MKHLFVLIVMIAFVFSINPSSLAQESAPQGQKWLLGSWTGILPGKEKTRSIEIKEINDSGTIANAHYGITGEKMYPIIITVNNDQIIFKTPADAKVDLKRASEIRMDGSFEMKGGRILPIRLWKNASAVDIDPHLKAFLGTWQGQWEWEGAPWGKPDLRYNVKTTIAYIDSISAAVLYEHSDFISLEGSHFKASWYWYHATVVTEKNIQCRSWAGDHFRGTSIFNFKISSNKKYLWGEIKGAGNIDFAPNSAKLRRAD